MKKLLSIIFLFVSMILSAQPYKYYVSPWTGNDTHSGLDTTNAWATWQKAFDTADAGDTVFFLGGQWYLGANEYVEHNPAGGHGHNGTHDNPIVFMNYTGKVPILDAIGHTNSTDANAFSMTGSTYVKLKGLIVQNEKMNNVAPTVDHWIASMQFTNCGNIYLDRVTARDGGGYGIWFVGYDTLYLTNTDSYNHYDEERLDEPGNRADGFQISSGSQAGDYTYIEGCRAWNNSDDGMEISAQGEFYLSNSWFFSNGYGTYGAGVGVKYGPAAIEHTPGKRRTSNCIAAFNDADAFAHQNLVQANDGPVGAFYNNISYRNRMGFTSDQGSFNCSTGFSLTVFRNNIVYQSNYGVVDGNYPSYYTNYFDLCGWTLATIDHNTFQYKVNSPYWEVNPSVTVTDADFVALPTSKENAITLLGGSRQSNGNLPTITLFHLAGESDLIEAGTAVGMSSSPDMGVDWAFLDAGAAPDDPTATDILTFVVASQVGSTTVNATNHTVTVHMPFGTNLTALQPTITLSPLATVSPTSGTATNFTNPVNYTVTGGDAVTDQVWVVTITNIDPDTNTDILTFTLAAQTGAASIDLVNHTVSIEVAYNTTVTSLSPTITVYGTATINPTSGTARNFTNPLTYTVTAQDAGTTQVWTVTVTVEPASPQLVIYTNNPDPIQSILATSGGNVTSDGGATVTQRGIVWGTSANPTTANNKIVASGTTGVYSVQIRGLLGNTTYHARSYAINSVGTSYGSNVSFTTPGSSIATSGGKVLIFNGLPAIWE
jgi:hypothetical protein